MKEFFKKNFAVIMAFALPILLMVVVGLSVYLPSLFISTQYNFIYSSCGDGTNNYNYDCNDYLKGRYSVVDGKIKVNPIDPLQDSDKDSVLDINENYTVRIFLHDTEKNEGREITLAEAQTLSLSELITSPDGVTLSSNYDRGADFLLFGGGSSYGHYLTKGKNKVKLNIINESDQYYYRDNLQFIGWILPGRN